MLQKTWGHVFTDNIRRLWFLKSEAFKKEFKNCPVVYLLFTRPPFNLEEQKDIQRLMEILGVDFDKLRLIEQPTQFDKIILPDEAFYGDNGAHKFTSEYREMIDVLRDFAIKNRTSIPNKRFYFHYGLRQVGEERIAEYFKSKGYEIITHKRRSNFDEELNLLINCESFAAPLGSVSHNSVFLRDNTEAIFISREAVLFNSYQWALNQVHPINCTYIDSTMLSFGNPFASYCFIISEQLKKFFGDKWDGYEEEDFKNFLQHIKNVMNKGRTLSPFQEKYYASVLPDFMTQLKQHKDLIESYNMPPYWETLRSSFNYRTHVANIGWGAEWLENNQISNDLEKQYTLQAIKISYPKHKVYYSVYYNDKEGWSEIVCSPEMAGTTGISKPICGMKVWLDEAGSKEFDILYRMHKFDGTWTPWATNGEALYSFGQRLNAIQIKLEPINTQSDETKTKETPNKVQPDKVNLKEFDYARMFFTEEDESIYLQGQRPKIKLKEDVI